MTAVLQSLRSSIGVPYMPFSYVSGLYTFGSQYTFGTNFNLERPFTGVRILFANYSTTAQTLAGFCVASSASTASRTTPVDTTGAPAAWTSGTVGGAAAVALPAAPSTAVPAYLLSDLIPIESYARTDGSPFSALFVRVLSATSGG